MVYDVVFFFAPDRACVYGPSVRNTEGNNCIISISSGPRVVSARRNLETGKSTAKAPSAIILLEYCPDSFFPRAHHRGGFIYLPDEITRSATAPYTVGSRGIILRLRPSALSNDAMCIKFLFRGLIRTPGRTRCENENCGVYVHANRTRFGRPLPRGGPRRSHRKTLGCPFSNATETYAPDAFFFYVRRVVSRRIKGLGRFAKRF